MAGRIAIAAMPYLGWSYRRDKPRVAYPSGSVPSSMVGGDRLTNCSTLTASVLMAVFPDAAWTIKEYLEIQVGTDPFREDSPIDAIVRVGHGRRLPHFAPDSWFLCQAWRAKGADGKAIVKRGGHAFLVFARAAGSGVGGLEQLQATGTSKGGVGPMYSSTTVDALRRRYPVLHVARLF